MDDTKTNTDHASTRPRPAHRPAQQQRPVLDHDGLPAISFDLLAASRRSESFPQDWSKERTEVALRDYRRFLLIAARNPGAFIAPTRDIDQVWHLHMLHPRAYATDCDRLMGRLLDHNGGFGADPEELPVLRNSFDETARLWQAEFGAAYAPAQAEPAQADPSDSVALHRCGGGDLAEAVHKCRGGDSRAEALHRCGGGGHRADDVHRCGGGDRADVLHKCSGGDRAEALHRCGGGDLAEASHLWPTGATGLA